LRTRTEMVLETLFFSPFNQLTRLVAWEDFIIKWRDARLSDTRFEQRPERGPPWQKTGTPRTTDDWPISSRQHWLGHSDPKFRCDTPSETFWVRFGCYSLLANDHSRGNFDHVYKHHQQSTFTSFPWWWKRRWSPKRWDFIHKWHGLLFEKILSSILFVFVLFNDLRKIVIGHVFHTPLDMSEDLLNVHVGQIVNTQGCYWKKINDCQQLRLEAYSVGWQDDWWTVKDMEGSSRGLI
jgi:hypothetical protein